MKTKLLMTALAAGVAVSTLMAAAPANAVVPISVSQSAYYSYAADVAAFLNSDVLCDFDSACVSGFSFAFAGGNAPGTGIFTGSTNGITAAPPGDGTKYASVLGPNGTATLSLGHPVNGISFYMGSPDTYNSITFKSGGLTVQSFFGAAFTQPPANGNQALGERITFAFNGNSVDSVVFGSTRNSFEFDRVGLAVPEPTSWALMILGFGLAGGMVRAKRRGQAFA